MAVRAGGVAVRHLSVGRCSQMEVCPTLPLFQSCWRLVRATIVRGKRRRSSRPLRDVHAPKDDEARDHQRERDMLMEDEDPEDGGQQRLQVREGRQA